MTTREEALEEMPSLVGTPGTGAYQRSNERCAEWYTRHYKTIRAALSPPDDVVELIQKEIEDVFSNAVMTIMECETGELHCHIEDLSEMAARKIRNHIQGGE